jgi:FkbM family methyltransferase
MRPGGTVIEAGGNIGSVAIALALHEPAARIASFEPDPMNFGLFQINLALNGCDNVRAFNLALGDHDGMAQLYRSPGNYGDHRTAKPKGLDLQEDAFLQFRNPVPLVKASRFLTEFLPGWKANLVKVDTQGADFEILGDLMSVLAPDAKVGIEFSPYHLDTNGTTFTEIGDVLTSFKKIFKIEPLTTPGYNLVPVSVDELRVFFDQQKARYQTYFDLALYA